MIREPPFRWGYRVRATSAMAADGMRQCPILSNGPEEMFASCLTNTRRDVKFGVPSRGRLGIFRCSAAAASRVQAADRRAYIGAVTDPTSPEILAWLESLPLREQLVTLHAMMFAIPTLQRNHRWKARITAAHAAIDPNAAQLADILTAARSRAKRLKEELAG